MLRIRNNNVFSLIVFNSSARYKIVQKMGYLCASQELGFLKNLKLFAVELFVYNGAPEISQRKNGAPAF